MGYFKKIVIHGLPSPSGLALASYFVFLLAWTFPPALYGEYVHEPDLMFLDVTTLCFYTACVACFWAGSKLSYIACRSSIRQRHAMIAVSSSARYIFTPLIIAIILCSIDLYVLGGRVNFVALLAAQNGNAIKMAGQLGELETGKWSGALFLLTATLWWAFYRVRQIRLSTSLRYCFRGVFVLGVLLDIATCAATVDRTELMPLFAGLLVVFLFRRSHGAVAHLYRIAFGAVAAIVSVVVLFVSFSILRGDAGIKILMQGFLGYTIVSYNRLAALLLGAMHDSYEGRGAFLFPVLKGSLIDNAFGLSGHFGWPSPLSAWLSAFSTVGSAGLNAAFNFYSAFGALYSDLGWGAPLYMYGVGFVAGYLWLLFKSGRTFALVLYPWCAFSILFWTGFNIMFDGRIYGVTKTAMVLVVYDWLMLRKQPSIGHSWSFQDPGVPRMAIPEPSHGGAV
jgi:hypothetical protein